jgi:hypothetical protein
MEKTLHRGFKLFQPWANDVVTGKLNYLVRTLTTRIRGRVAVIATEGVDRFWIDKATDEEVLSKGDPRIGAIGSVEIIDCIAVKPKNIKQKLIKLGGDSYYKYYPKHLILRNKEKLYIWVLQGAKEWRRAKKVNSEGILWARINMRDE